MFPLLLGSTMAARFSCAAVLVTTAVTVGLLQPADASTANVVPTTLFNPDTFIGGIWNSVVGFFMEAEGWLIPFIPVRASFLDLILALDTCASYRRHMKNKKHPWLQVFVSCMIGTFGGTTAAAFLLGHTPGWMHSSSSPISFLLGFWCIFCCPGDVPFKLITRNRSVELLFGYINSLSLGHAISSWGSDGALSAYHVVQANGSGPLTLLSGAIAGCGGGIIANWLSLAGLTPEWNFGTPPVLKGPSITVKAAFMGSGLYYILRNPHGSLPYNIDAFMLHDEAKTVIWLFFVVILTLHEIMGVNDPTAAFSQAVGAICLCPAELGGDPQDGVYEMVMGKGHSAEADKDAALSGFGFVKAKPEDKKSKGRGGSKKD